MLPKWFLIFVLVALVYVITKFTLTVCREQKALEKKVNTSKYATTIDPPLPPLCYAPNGDCSKSTAGAAHGERV